MWKQSIEARIRDLIIQLKTDGENVRCTILDLCWDMEELLMDKTCDTLHARRMDLETAVLMQELMAIREDRAELRQKLFSIQKDKKELQIQILENQQQQLQQSYNNQNSEITKQQLQLVNCVAEKYVTPPTSPSTETDNNANRKTTMMTNDSGDKTLKRQITDICQ